MRKILPFILITSTVVLWIWLAYAVVHQRYRHSVVDPKTDTGISFGFTFLIYHATPAVLVCTLIVAVILACMKRGSKTPEIETQKR